MNKCALQLLASHRVTFFEIICRLGDVIMEMLSTPETFRSVKCVVVGDSDVGKTSLLSSYCRHVFPVKHVPTIFDDDYGQCRKM